MSVGLAIFLSALIFAVILLYAITRDRWNWKRGSHWIAISLGSSRKDLNWKRGLFRLWLLTAVAWIFFLVLQSNFLPATRALIQGAPSRLELTKQDDKARAWVDECERTKKPDNPYDCIDAAPPGYQYANRSSYSREDALHILQGTVFLALGVPVAILLAWFSAAWTVRGFRRDANKVVTPE